MVFCATCATALIGQTATAQVKCGGPDSNGTKLCQVDPSIDASALCNNHSTPSFYFRPGISSSTWVIWLEGGGWCIDATSCSERNRYNVTGKLTTANDGAGVLSNDSNINPLLYNANTVVIHYCSSDRWSGNSSLKTAKFDMNNPNTWDFEGRRIALAAVASLKQLGLASATQILLGGSSAGAEGMTFVANDIIPTLPTSNVLVANDSGFGIDIGQYDDSVAASPTYAFMGHPNAFETFVATGAALWSGTGDSKCLQNGGTQVECYTSSYVLQNGYIAKPVFVDIAEMDAAQLTYELCPQLYGNCPFMRNVPSQVDYANYFSTIMISAVIGSGTQANYSAYSPDSTVHVMLTDPTQFTKPHNFPGGPKTPRDAFNAWYMNPTGPRQVLIGNSPDVPD
jgi:hypothetical protein